MITVDITPTVAIKNVTPMTEDEARESIEQINKGIQFIRRKLLELQQRRGWESLGYDSWKACCEQEFHSDRRRLNYMIQAANVEFELVSEGVDQGKIFPVQLEVWLESPLPPVTQDFGQIPIKPFVGAKVRIREELLSNRLSLMKGAEGIIQHISGMGRLVIESFGRIEYFDQTEVEVLSGAS